MNKKFAWTCLTVVVLAGGCRTGNQDCMEVDVRTKIYPEKGKSYYSEYEKHSTRTVDCLAGLSMARPKTNSYGSLADVKADSTGFFHTVKINDRWYLVDPDGCLHINIGVCALSPLRSEAGLENMKKKYGDKETWLKSAAELLRDHSFNSAGAWSDIESVREYNKTNTPLSYSVIVNFMSKFGQNKGLTHQQAGHKGYRNDALPVFDPTFPAFCDSMAQTLTVYKNDKFLLGYFTDNELPFYSNSLKNYLSLPSTDPNYIATIQWMIEKKYDEKNITDEAKRNFLAFIGEKYFSVICSAIRKYDPDHLILGSRFYTNEKETKEFMQAVGKYLDVISINYYLHWSPDTADVQNWTTWTKKPFMVTEFYAKGEDTGMGNQDGAGFLVKTQKDRGLFYQNFILGLLESRNCVGWHYFKYADNDPNDKTADPSNRDSNKGIVNISYEPYVPMLEEMKKVNENVYSVIEYFDGKK